MLCISLNKSQSMDYIDKDITIRKNILIGKCNNHINYLYPCSWSIASLQKAHDYKKHVRAISLEFCPSLLIYYYLPLTAHMLGLS